MGLVATFSVIVTLNVCFCIRKLGANGAGIRIITERASGRRRGYQRIREEPRDDISQVPREANCGRFCSPPQDDHTPCEMSRRLIPSDFTSSSDSNPGEDVTRLTTESGGSPSLRTSTQYPCYCNHVDSTIYCTSSLCQLSNASNNNGSTDREMIPLLDRTQAPLHQSSTITDSSASTSRVRKQTPYPTKKDNKKPRR